MDRRKIRFQPSGREVSVASDSSDMADEESSLLAVANANGIGISSSCGGYGTCGTCLIDVLDSKGELPPRNEIEQEMADMRVYQSHERLACQLNAFSCGVRAALVRFPEKASS